MVMQCLFMCVIFSSTMYVLTGNDNYFFKVHIDNLKILLGL